MCVFVILNVVSSKGRVFRGRKWIVMKSECWIWTGDENRKRKYIMTQRKCLLRTGKQVAVHCDRDGSTCGDQTLRNATSRKYCQQPGDDNNQHCFFINGLVDYYLLNQPVF